MPQMFDDVGEIVEEALRRVGKRVVLALPLGIGKPNLIANEFFRRARGDATLDLTIFTALSLRKPTGSSPLEKAFIEPLAARVFGNYPDLDYLAAIRQNDVPPNVRIIEFFFEPGSQLNSAHAQSHYLCANYTHVARELLARGVNVIAHVVAKRVVGGNTEISLGSNPDVTVDLLPEVAKLRAAGTPVVLLGQVHREMPFMLGAANLPAEDFDLLLDHSRYDYDLFAPPNPSLSTVDHAIGLHASSLVRDGGTLQIGIGELGDSIVYSLLLRHQQNEAWRRALMDAGTERSAALVDSVGGRAPFATGLFGATEMFVDQMLDLYRAGILRRRVYDYLPLQRALATNGSITRIDESLLEALLAAGAGPLLDASDVAALKNSGVLRRETRFENGNIISPDGLAIEADLGNAKARAALARDCLGLHLQGGTVMHAGFLLGPRSFYSALCALPENERRLFDMRGVGYINQLYGEDLALTRGATQPCALREHDDDADDARRCGLRWPRRRPRGFRRRRAIQLRHHGARAAGCAVGAVRALHAPERRQARLEHRDELWTHHDSAPPSRHRRHRIRHRRPARPHRRRVRGRHAEHRGFALPGGIARGGKTRQQDRRRLPDSRAASAQHAGSARRSLRRAAPRGPVLGVSVRHRSHA